MSTLLVLLAIGAVVAAAVLAVVIAGYRRLVTGLVAVEDAWEQLRGQLVRRHDIVPDLVRTLSGERKIVARVTAARAAAAAAGGPAEHARAERILTGALADLLAAAATYSRLQNSPTFADLQAALVEADNRISYTRQYYNEKVQAYNDAVRKAPVLAGLTGFAACERFAVAP